MKLVKICLSIALVGLFVYVSGCSVRRYEVEKPRQDIEISGNRGYLQGTPKDTNSTISSTSRKFTVIEVEMGKPVALDLEEDSSYNNDYNAVVDTEDADLSYNPSKDEGSEYRLYTVQKSDTLQKISQKFYNTTKKWKKIYEYNKDILKSPDKVYPGQIIKIP